MASFIAPNEAAELRNSIRYRPPLGFLPYYFKLFCLKRSLELTADEIEETNIPTSTTRTNETETNITTSTTARNESEEKDIPTSKTTSDDDDKPANLPWCAPTCFTVVSYVMRFCSQNHSLRDTIMYLDDLAAVAIHLIQSFALRQSRFLDVEAMGAAIPQIYNIFVNSFIPEMRNFFAVPKPDQLSEKDKHLKRNEILAAFMDFLVTILKCEESSSDEEDSEHSADEEKSTDYSDGEQPFAILQKELTFLLAFLGDIPFQSGTHHHDLEEEVNDLLAEFEMLANEAGSFIYSCILSIRPIKANKFYAGRNALLEKVELLNVKIRQHCIRFSEFPRFHATSRSDVDSFFIVNSLVEDLDNMMNHQVNFTLDAATIDEIETLHLELMLSQTLLKIIEVQQDTVRSEVKDSFIQIRELAYEAEYLINSHVVGNIPVWYLNLRLPSVIQKVKHTNEKLQKTEKLHETKAMKGSLSDVSSQALGTLEAMDNDLCMEFDFQGQIEEMIRADLIQKQNTRNTISIFGMPGLGKTTIAKKLYNCRQVCDYFDRRAWCNVSQTYNLRELLIRILKSVDYKSKDDKILEMKDDELGVAIHKILTKRRYLIVLDDVWYINVWEGLQRYFPDDGNGSRIMITSRIKGTAPDGTVFHTLPFLSTDQSWALLQKKVFPKEPCPTQLLTVGKKIAEKCYGVPLAVVVAAGILMNSEEESEWEKVEKQLGTLLLDDERDYKMILELSYKCLPHNIKPCFLYFGAFPEDAEVSVRKLKWLWIAEGFIRKEEKKTPEEIAEMYLADLINRSLVMTATRGSDGRVKACKIHDLMREICISKAHEENFLKSVKDDFSIYEKHQHLHVGSTSDIYWGPFGLLYRSLIGRISHPSNNFPKMPLLRVMDMPRTKEKYKVPTGFEFPVYLRYLGFDRMPKGILDNFVNLEFCCIENKDTTYVPLAFLRLAKLRHILIKKEVRFEGDFDDLGTTNLRSLSYVNIGDEEGEAVLRHSPYLRELKCTSEGETGFPDLGSLTELESLKIAFDYTSVITLSKIEFPTTIKKLCLEGSKFPWEKMSAIGRLPNLCVLKLQSDAFKGDEWETLDDEFEKLRFLKLESLDLRQWTSCSDHFPQLEHLVLSKCENLEDIPNDLGSIPTLHTIKVHHCRKEVSLSAVQIGEEQRGYGNGEFRVVITNYE